jgi:hypothetical protein
MVRANFNLGLILMNFGQKFSSGRGLAYIGISLSQYYNFFNDKIRYYIFFQLLF